MKQLLTTTLLLAIGMCTLTAGDIVGTVKKYNNLRNGVSGARVEAVLRGKVVATTYTDTAGKYRMNNLPHSTSYYSVRATYGSLSGSNPNCALFLPGKVYPYPATCNITLYPRLVSMPAR